MQDTDDFYKQNARQFFTETLNLDMNALYLPFVSLLPQGAQVLDAGCGSGRDSKNFRDLGFTVTAFDSSIEMCKLAAKNTNASDAVCRGGNLLRSKRRHGHQFLSEGYAAPVDILNAGRRNRREAPILPELEPKRRKTMVV